MKKVTKPFNLEEAKAGKPICDLTGARVKFIAHVPEAPKIERVVVLYPGVGVVAYDEGGSGNLHMATIQGYIVSQKPTLLLVSWYLP